MRELGGTRALRRPLPRGGRRARCSCRGGGPGLRSPLWMQRKRAPTCSRSPRATAPSRSSWRPTASACRTCSTCRRFVELAAARAAPRAAASSPWTRPTPSPFAASLLFGYVANYLYDGDAPAGRAPRAGARRRPGAAARAAGRGRAARAARPRGARRAGGVRCRRSTETQRVQERRPPARPAAAPRRPHAGRDRARASSRTSRADAAGSASLRRRRGGSSR